MRSAGGCWCWRCTALTGRPTRSRRCAARATSLAEELGVDPGPALRELEAEVLAQSPRSLARAEAARAATGPARARRQPPAVPTGHVGLVERRPRAGRPARSTSTTLAARAAAALLLIEGPAGIGKTRLLRGGRAGWRPSDRRAGARRAGAASWSRAFGFGVVRQLFEPLLTDPRRRDAAAGAGQRSVRAGCSTSSATTSTADGSFAVLHGLYWLTVNLTVGRPAGADRSTTLQWCDAASLRFLAYLARRLEGLPVLVVADGARPASERQRRGAARPSSSLRAGRGRAAAAARCRRTATADAGPQPARRAADDAVRRRPATARPSGNPLLLRPAAAGAGGRRGTGRTPRTPTRVVRRRVRGRSSSTGAAAAAPDAARRRRRGGPGRGRTGRPDADLPVDRRRSPELDRGPRRRGARRPGAAREIVGDEQPAGVRAPVGAATRSTADLPGRGARAAARAGRRGCCSAAGATGGAGRRRTCCWRLPRRWTRTSSRCSASRGPSRGGPRGVRKRGHLPAAGAGRAARRPGPRRDVLLELGRLEALRRRRRRAVRAPRRRPTTSCTEPADAAQRARSPSAIGRDAGLRQRARRGHRLRPRGRAAAARPS